MRFIDKEALMKSIQENPAVDGNHRAAQLLECIMNAPTIDAVPVVRCRECKYWKHNLENDTYCSGPDGLSDPEEDDFCSYGELKGEN